MKKILAAENLSYSINEAKLFQGLSFELHEGNAIHVLGSNGSGKTSLLRIISGLTKPTRGIIKKYNTKNIYAGVPVVIGSDGVEKIVELSLTLDEEANFKKSVESVKDLFDAAKKIDPDLK